MPHAASSFSASRSAFQSQTFRRPAPEADASRARITARRAIALYVLLTASLLIVAPQAVAQKKRRPPPVGRVAVIVDERLAVLRDAPGFRAELVRRLGRGTLLALTGQRVEREGATFYRIAVTRRTAGWLQSEAFVSPARAGDDARLLRLVRGSEGFDRLTRARIFLETFPRSALRPAALLLLADAADSAAATLSRDARRRLNTAEMEAGGAPLRSYFLNYNGLDRYRRQGVVYLFDAADKRFRYDGAAWREILRRHPRSTEAVEARSRLAGIVADTR